MQFSSTTNTLHGGSGSSGIESSIPTGNARFIQNLTISLPPTAAHPLGSTFNDLVFDMNDMRSPAALRTTVDVVLSLAGVLGPKTTDSFTFSGGDLAIFSTPSEVIDSVTINSFGFGDLKLEHMSGPFAETIVPEPSTFVLMLTGLAAVLIYGLCRRRHHHAMA